MDEKPTDAQDALLTPLEAQGRACPSARLNQGATKEQIAALEVPALALVLAVEAADRVTSRERRARRADRGKASVELRTN